MSESSGIPTPGVYTMGSPVGMEWTTGSPRTLGHSVGGGEEAEHRVTASNRLMYMTTTAKISMAQQLGDRGAMTIDEIRELFNYPPLPDGLGNRSPIRGEYYFVQEEGDTNGN